MRFYIVDVFAENKYQGNQLAVFILNKILSINEMQQIAKEIHFSETTFIISDKKIRGGYDVRIFTPDVEVPFAGHPTLGTAFVIAQILETHPHEKIILNLPIGQIPVTLLKDKNELWMRQMPPTFGACIEASVIAEILQIDEADIQRNYPMQIVSTGLPALIIPLTALSAVQKCVINHKKYQDFLDRTSKVNLLVFTPEVINHENDLHVRVFVDDKGFYEDPATGSANGNLAAYLLKHQFFQTSKIDLRIEQGYGIGRPSLIKVKAEQMDDHFHIDVGGQVFFVAEGRWL